MRNKYVVIDLETTGNSPKKGDKIIQFAACVVENGKITGQYSSFVNPGKEIPSFIEELTGITAETVGKAPFFFEIAPKIASLLEEAVFVAHNAVFDLSFLQNELQEAGFAGFNGPVLDTVELARILLPGADSYRLGELAALAGIDHERPHQADSDALVTAQLLLMFMDRLLAMPRVTLSKLVELSKKLKNDLSVLFEEQLYKKDQTVETLAPDLEIYRGIALKKYRDPVFNPPGTDKRETSPYPSAAAQKELLFKKAFPRSEERSAQFQMMDAVYASFTDNEHAVIETGADAGKTMAYLVPAAYFAKETREKVVISAYTLQLQKQLLENDVPLMKTVLPFHIEAALLKGRNNYLNLAKFIHSLHEDDRNYDTVMTKMQILVWLLETETGDYDELHLSGGGMRFIEKLNRGACFDTEGEAKARYDFYHRALTNAKNADLIITNHYCLLAAAAAKNSVFPTCRYCIIDDGHHFYKAAGSFFGESFDYFSVRTRLQRFSGLEKILFHDEAFQQWPAKELPHPFQLSQLYDDLLWETEEFFANLINFAKEKAGTQNHHRLTVRLSKQKFPFIWRKTADNAQRLVLLLKDMQEFLQVFSRTLKSKNIANTNKGREVSHNLELFIQDLEDMRVKLRSLFIEEDGTTAVWIETDVRAPHNTTTVFAQPVSVASRLRESFFGKMNSAVVTSATLTAENSFHFILNELGLDEGECRTVKIPAPFMYRKQVKMIVPDDLPEVNAVSSAEYVSSICQHIVSVAEAVQGRILILFTSREMLKQTYDWIAESGLLVDYALIAQDVSNGSRNRLLKKFLRFEKAILFGTNSFWEGIDIQGEKLSCLIMARLPFSPPTDPLTEAKSEWISRNGGNSFLDYSLPEAIIRFKQGLGRLLRSEGERGVALILDRRIMTASYGKAFLQSVPRVPVTEANIKDAATYIRAWLHAN